MKIRDSVADWAEALEVPAEAVTDAVKVTLTGGRRAVVQYHRGLLGYTSESVEISAGTSRVRILGGGLLLRAMDSQTLVVTGRISGVEYA